MVTDSLQEADILKLIEKKNIINMKDYGFKIICLGINDIIIKCKKKSDANHLVENGAISGDGKIIFDNGTTLDFFKMCSNAKDNTKPIKFKARDHIKWEKNPNKFFVYLNVNPKTGAVYCVTIYRREEILKQCNEDNFLFYIDLYKSLGHINGPGWPINGNNIGVEILNSSNRADNFYLDDDEIISIKNYKIEILKRASKVIERNIQDDNDKEWKRVLNIINKYKGMKRCDKKQKAFIFLEKRKLNNPIVNRNIQRKNYQKNQTVLPIF